MTVNVLMSTYNGERYVEEQIKSILGQKNVDVDLLVRDDGSSDSTLDILDAGKENGILHWYKGCNLGPAYSFLDLLAHSSSDADYYAFSDQDDFWLPEKLSVAAEMLSAAGNSPALYFSRTQMTDAELHPTSIVEIDPLLSFGESLVYEFIPGCTMVMNHTLRDIVNQYRPAYLPMHDVWVYSVALAIGAKVFFDKEPHILYRQHANNSIRQGYSMWHEWKRKWNRFANSEHSRSRRAIEIKTGYKHLMNDANLGLLNDFIEARKHFDERMLLCIDNRLNCARWSTRQLFRVALLLNSY